MPSTSLDAAQADDKQEPDAGIPALLPQLSAALDALAGKQAELETSVRVALYRSEQAVRAEQLAGVQQAMMSLEMQFRRLAVTQQQAHPASTAVPEPVDALVELSARVAALEAAVTAAGGGLAGGPVAGSRTEGASGGQHSTTEPSQEVRLQLSVLDSGLMRVRLAVDELSEAADEPEVDEVMSPAARRLLDEVAITEAAEAAVEFAGTSLQAALMATGEVRAMRSLLGDLTSVAAGLQAEAAGAAEERTVLRETLAELQDRLDSQVVVEAVCPGIHAQQAHSTSLLSASID